MLRHADRFMIGSDTYLTSRWEAYGDLIAQHRAWLAQLPPETARAIAFDNAARLFGKNFCCATASTCPSEPTSTSWDSPMWRPHS